MSELDGIQSGVGPVLIINDGNAQRSMIDNLTVVFQKPVSLSVLTGSGAFTTTGAFTLENTSGTFVSVNYSNPSGDDKTWLISFTNSMSFSLDSDGSLPNGGYTLSVVQSDTSGAGAPGSNVNYTFARLYGDFYGTLTANFGDLVYVLQHYDQTVQPGMWFTDQNQDGVIGFDELVGVLDDYDHLEGANNSGAIFKGASQTQDVGGVGNITAGLSPQEFYYSASWQILQQNECNPTTGLMQTANQFVWGLAYVNELVLRDSDSDGDSSTGGLGKSGSGLDLRLYAAQDANYNVVALINTSGTVVQRFDTTPYGTVTVLSASGVPTLDSYGWQIGFQGGWVDKMSGLIWFQNRLYNPATDTWTTQDPLGDPGFNQVFLTPSSNAGLFQIGAREPNYSSLPPSAKYIDGMDVYQFLDSNPLSARDPSGLDRYIYGYGHLGIAVDTWALVDGKWVKTGVTTYDFSVNYSPWNWILIPVSTYSFVPGEVTPFDRKTEVGLPGLVRIPSTPMQDTTLRNNLDHDVIDPPPYQLLTNNCRDFAKDHARDGMPPLPPPQLPPPPLPIMKDGMPLRAG